MAKFSERLREFNQHLLSEMVLLRCEAMTENAWIKDYKNGGVYFKYLQINHQLMNLSDQDFREAFKPLQVPAHYQDVVSDEDKLIFALAQMNHGTAGEIVRYLATIDTSIDTGKFDNEAHSILSRLFNSGLINGKMVNDELVFDLSKITIANDGSVDPDLLAPGLD